MIVVLNAKVPCIAPVLLANIDKWSSSNQFVSILCQGVYMQDERSNTRKEVSPGRDLLLMMNTHCRRSEM